MVFWIAMAVFTLPLVYFGWLVWKKSKEPLVTVDDFLAEEQKNVLWFYRSKQRIKQTGKNLHSVTVFLGDGTKKLFPSPNEMSAVEDFETLRKHFPEINYGWNQEAFLAFNKDPFLVQQMKFQTDELDVGYRGFYLFQPIKKFLIKFRNPIQIVFLLLLILNILTRTPLLYTLYNAGVTIDKDLLTFVFLGWIVLSLITELVYRKSRR